MKRKISIKPIILLIIICSSFLLTSCSNSLDKQITDLKGQIEILKTQNSDLIEEIASVKSLSAENQYKNGSFKCDNDLAGIKEVKFLAATVIYVTGISEDGTTTINNYYLLKTTDNITFTLVDEILLKDSLSAYSYEALQLVPGLMRTWSISNDGKQLTYSPVTNEHTCNWKAN